MPALLLNPKRNIRKDACLLLSNVAAGTLAQIRAIVKNPRIVQRVVASINDGDWEVCKEAVWVAYNIATRGKFVHSQAIVHFDGIEALCNLLHVADTKILTLVLDTLEHLLKVGKRQGRAWDCLVHDAGGVDKLKDLRQHESDAIFQKAVAIIKEYFNGDAEDETENLAPSSQGNKYLCFWR